MEQYKQFFKNSLLVLHSWISFLTNKDLNTETLQSNQLFYQEMQNLTIINISLVDRTNYHKFAVKFHITNDFFTTVPQLQIFRVRTKGEITFSPDALQKTKHLRVLDFTRTKYLDLQSFYGSVEKQNTSIETLILKNVQTLSPTGQFPYVASVDLSKIACPLSKTLQKLDLSHNDIQSIYMSQTTGCVYWFDELDLSYNLIINNDLSYNLIINGLEGVNPTFYLSLFSSLLRCPGYSCRS